MTKRKAEILLAAVIIVRATAFVFSKNCLADMSTFNLLSMRFLTGFILLAAIFWKRLSKISTRTLVHGVVLGALFFVMMTFEVNAIQKAETSTVSALENTAIIIVPLLDSVLKHRKAKAVSLLCAAVALSGVILMNMTKSGLNFSTGEFLALVAAFIYASVIIATSRYSHAETDCLTLGIVQVGTLGALSLIASLIFEQPHLPSTPAIWAMVAILAIVCTGFGFTLQPVAQRYINTQTAGLMCALNPVVAVTLGAIVLHEALNIRDLFGIALILSSLLLPHILPENLSFPAMFHRHPRLQKAHAGSSKLH